MRLAQSFSAQIRLLLVLTAFRRIGRTGAPGYATTRFALTSSMGANARSRFYTRTKGELEDAVVCLGFPSLTILRPGFIGGDRKEHRPMEHVMGGILRFMDPVLPPVARISPAWTIAFLRLEAVIGGAVGNHRLGAAEIASASR